MCKCPCTKIRESASFGDRLLFFWAHHPKVGQRFQARRRKELLNGWKQVRCPSPARSLQPVVIGLRILPGEHTCLTCRIIAFLRTYVEACPCVRTVCSIPFPCADRAGARDSCSIRLLEVRVSGSSWDTAEIRRQALVQKQRSDRARGRRPDQRRNGAVHVASAAMRQV